MKKNSGGVSQNALTAKKDFSIKFNSKKEDQKKKKNIWFFLEPWKKDIPRKYIFYSTKNEDAETYGSEIILHLFAIRLMLQTIIRNFKETYLEEELFFSYFSVWNFSVWNFPVGNSFIPALNMLPNFYIQT